MAPKTKRKRKTPSYSALSRDLAASHARILGLEDRLANACEKVFNQAGKIAAKNFEQAALSHVVASAWTPPDPDEIVDVDAIVAALHTKADPIRRSAIREYGAALDGVADWDVTNPLAAGVLAGAGQHVTDIAETTRLNVMRTIGASYDQGLSIPETAKAIQAGMREASAARGRLIARTELAAVANGGSLAASQIFADATGATLYKRWLTAPGAKEPRHEDYEGLNGTTVALDDAFDVGGAQLQFPGDPDGPPEEICNCRCTLIYVDTPSEEVAPAGEVDLDPTDDELSSYDDLSEQADIGPLTEDEKALGDAYVNGKNVEIQAALREGEIPDEMALTLRGLDTFLGRSTLEEDAVTTRGIGDLRAMFGRPPKVGDIGYDPAYTSTTTSEKTASKFARGPDAGYVTYHLEAGQNALWIPSLEIPFAQVESELLLPRGLPLRVIGVGKRDGLPDVHVEIVGRSGASAPQVSEFGKLAQVELLPLRGDSPYSYAGSIIQNAARSEAQVTAALLDAIVPRGYMEGLPFRVKSAPSVARKIELERVSKKVPLSAAAHEIKDGLRYTAVFQPASYVRDMTATLDSLKAKAGIVPERITATWGKGTPYAGTNIVMRSPNGLRFELQFHTPQSFDVKENINHPLYQQARRLGVPDKEVQRLNNVMVKNADGVVRPPGIHEWKYQASVEADVGVTPFRAGTDDPFGFYDTDRYKQFEKSVKHLADSYGVEIDEQAKVSGVWEGEKEPAVSLHVHDGEKGVAAFAADLGKAYDQDGVLLFSPTIGGDVIATFDRVEFALPEAAEASIFDAMKRAGLPAGRFLEDGRLQIIGSGPEFVAQLDAVARDLGVGYDAGIGRFSLLLKENGDYEAALRDFASSTGKQVRAAEGVVAEHGGPAALGPGAAIGEAGARQVASTVEGVQAAPLPAIPHYSLAEIKAMGDDDLWEALAINGKIENLARADITTAESRRLRAELWKRGAYPGGLRLKEIASDGQVHSTFSDGHNTIREMALAAQKRGMTGIVVSDHSRLMTAADVARQHRQIDKLNAEPLFRLGRGALKPFKILKGVEVSILEDGSLDMSLTDLARFDVVNAAIHGTEAAGGQQVLFARPPTERLLKALDNVALTVLVHPHAVAADWDAVAIKAAANNVALEINGRSLLRADSAEEAAKMIAAAKEHGAKLAIGSDAHNAGDLIDAAYAARFAAEHGVTADDLVSFQRIGVPDLGSSLPGDREITLGRIGSRRLGGGINVVWKVQRGDEYLIVKPEPDPDLARKMFDASRLRDGVKPGLDLERERAAYIVSRYFNDAGAGEFEVFVPPYRISTIIQPGALNRAESRAGIATFVEGEEARRSANWEADMLDTPDELRSAGIFDALIANEDRHGGNFLFGDDGHVWLIDHGLAFPEVSEDPDFYNSRIQDLATAEFDGLTPREIAFLERLRDRWGQIERELADAGLPAQSTAAMKERLDYMIATGDSTGYHATEDDPFDFGPILHVAEGDLHTDTDGNLRNSRDELVDEDGEPLGTDDFSPPDDFGPVGET